MSQAGSVEESVNTSALISTVITWHGTHGPRRMDLWSGFFIFNQTQI